MQTTRTFFRHQPITDLYIIIHTEIRKVTFTVSLIAISSIPISLKECWKMVHINKRGLIDLVQVRTERCLHTVLIIIMDYIYGPLSHKIKSPGHSQWPTDACNSLHNTTYTHTITHTITSMHVS